MAGSILTVWPMVSSYRAVGSTWMSTSETWGNFTFSSRGDPLGELVGFDDAHVVGYLNYFKM